MKITPLMEKIIEAVLSGKRLCIWTPSRKACLLPKIDNGGTVYKSNAPAKADLVGKSADCIIIDDVEWGKKK